jgi:PQQ-dependent catabolism-associated CXXCW motif protein
LRQWQEIQKVLRSLNMKYFVLLFCGLLTALSAQAMRVEVHGNLIYASGPVGNDVGQFQSAMAIPEVDTVVFVNSPGGDLWTGMQVGRMIADKGLKTVIAGSCVSACSIMFMGGKSRSFSDAFRPALTYIGIHGAHNSDTKTVNAQLQPQIFAFYKQHMGERFNAALMNTALYDMDDAGGLLRIFDAHRTPRQTSYHCRSAQTLRRNCTDFPAVDALNLGIVTSSTLTQLELPANFKETPQILGQTLTQTLADPTAYFEQLGTQQCTTDTCLRLIKEYGAHKEHKALAIPVGASGLGTVGARDTAISAFVGAIYACNHVKGLPARLCEAQNANGYDLRALYTLGATSHKEALAKLAAPADPFYADEQYGGGMTRAEGFRTQKVHDITPQSIDGIQVFGTQALALALLSPQAPVLIDVWAGVNDAIPTAVTLLSGGLAFDNAMGDGVYEMRFAGLLKLLSPDPATPVVFYCESRNCWLSVNAALRAKKLGYTQVGWYRGGMASWKAANLPLASVVVRAVVR